MEICELDYQKTINVIAERGGKIEELLYMTIFNGIAEQKKYKRNERIGNIANSLFVLHVRKEPLLI